MAVRSPWQARETLRLLINSSPVPIGSVLHEPLLPAGMRAVADQPRTLPDSTPVGGYGNQARYDFPPEVAAIVASSPAEVLAGRPSITSEQTRAFLTASLDLTMQGGTTSGVVYPLAVCELATAFRFRNVGGASAGAIAAAFTAAAELGRSERARGHDLGFLPPATPDPPGTPRVRPGFAGLADVLAWLTQTGPGDPAKPDEFRLAQLFRPGRATFTTFRVAVAAMRGRTWPLPLLALSAFGWVTRAVAAVLILLTIAVTGWVGARFAGEVRPWYETVGWGLLETSAFVVTLIGAILMIQGALKLVKFRAEVAERRRTAGTALGALNEVSSGAPIPRTAVLPNLLIGAGLLGLGVMDLVWRPGPFFGAAFVGLAGLLLVLVWLTAQTWFSIGRFSRQAYGLIGGTAPLRPRTLLDRLAAVPEPTVTPSLVPWLHQCLGQLAGLPDGTVLRFGHLWDGVGYRDPTQPRTPEDVARWQAQREQNDRRLINLELMTTDLTRRRPYKFPLTPSPDPSDELWLRLDQMEAVGVFPPAVLSALGQTESRVVENADGKAHRYHRLPAPWDLPVVFAVRLSMALPGLFRAVPLHRLVADTPIRDDLGRQLMIGDRPLTTFTVEGPVSGPVVGPVPTERAEELWFSDGGITSNFPVHFFDASLPRWPTVSLNLGRHPEANPVQDVWLPQDWDPIPTPVEPLARSGLSLPAAIVDTAMSWRDSMQSAMPGYRSRIAQVRARTSEGGTNLFMATDTIASLGLRGVVAGARLRNRYSDPPQWDRFRWLRLRVALSNIDRLRDSTSQRRGVYSDALGDPAWLATLAAGYGGTPTTIRPPGAAPSGNVTGPDAQLVPWYRPEPGFYPSAGDLLGTFAQAYAPGEVNVMRAGAPRPEPVLRQVPQE